MAGRRKNLLHQAKVDKPRIENPSKATSTGRTIYGGVESLVNEKKIAFAREKKTFPPKIEKPYDPRNFYAGIDIIGKHDSEKFVASRSNEVLVLRQEIKDWKSHEDRANAVEDKLSRIESGISASGKLTICGEWRRLCVVKRAPFVDVYTREAHEICKQHNHYLSFYLISRKKLKTRE